jgi:hypothetical protein
MTVQHRIFRSSTKTWEELCDEVSQFASPLGSRLINISVAAAGGSDVAGWGSKGVVFVWYWE